MMATTKCSACCMALSAAECDHSVHTHSTGLGPSFLASAYAMPVSSIATQGKGTGPRRNCRSCDRRTTSHDETHRGKNQEHDEKHIGNLGGRSGHTRQA